MYGMSRLFTFFFPPPLSQEEPFVRTSHQPQVILRTLNSLTSPHPVQGWTGDPGWANQSIAL